ncbi:pentapeptide repeat-containing protein (plasmid) [Burkholderia sp. FERM BP-3421]|jgi:fluoroquinolone resistance protein|uniref:pentapeptide repeat-containing protein n=1 Tax=Burkholderia sp. FERM BP-3421 TaxID=1494466 RepID=UPI00236148D0|nr:pentapeptide repeat-containing protein [Burkholderia sp. FERM BP-3421]WDD90656.1 pentapeptide repeat-containing protein [Burkholderia sp. FERM BP-3421]
MRSNANEPSFKTGAVFRDLSLCREELAALLRDGGEAPTFDHCTFDDQDLSSLDFHAVRFSHCSFTHTLLERCGLAGSRWLACMGARAKFRYADLTDARFCRGDLNNTDWTGAQLASAIFTEVKLTGARLVGAWTLGLGIHDSLLVAADLRGMPFRKQTPEALNFSGADLSECDFRDGVFEGGSLRNARLRDSRFDGADLRSVDLSGLRLADVSKHLKGTILSVDQAVALVGDCGVRVM